MFSGIVAAVGTVRAVKPARGGVRLVVDTGRLGLKDVAAGDSIAVDGVCLTVVARKGRTFEADVSRATLACTTGFAGGHRVNLEKAMRLSDRPPALSAPPGPRHPRARSPGGRRGDPPAAGG